jgi:hypothetical protein
MSFPALSAAVAMAARSAGASTHADVTEGELLRTYASSRAEAPFADLVRRRQLPGRDVGAQRSEFLWSQRIAKNPQSGGT